MSSMARVAHEAQVAVSTVSLTLNHREQVKPETRERVEQAIRRLGYRPRSKIQRGREELSAPIRVAFVYTPSSLDASSDQAISGYGREVISGMQESIAAGPSSLSIFRGLDHIDQDIIFTEQVKAREFDGIVLFGAEARDGYLDRLQNSGIPLVAINRLPEHGQFSYVTVDYFGGGYLAIDHLAAMGHRRLALALRDTQGKWLARELAAGAGEALQRHKLQPVMNADPQELMAQESLERFCRAALEHGASVVFAGDHVAVRCVDILAKLGARVPEQLSVLGFDNRGLMSSGGQRLSSIGYDKRRMGRMAVRMLQQIHLSQGKLRWLGAAVATEFVSGDTTAAAPAV